MPNPRNPIGFRPGPLASALEARGDNLAEVVRRDLGRYYQLLERELRWVRLSEGEASLLCDALNGSLIDDPQVLEAEIADACDLDGLHAKWAIDRDALLASLRSWTYAQRVAVLDAVERYWRGPYQLPRAEGLRAVGLVRDERRAP
jgi:hypothetical protein